MRLEELSGKKVALWGYGREGRATLELLRQRLPELPVTVLDEAPLAVEVCASLASAVVTGPEAAAALPRFDVVVKSPGISPYRGEVEAARRQGVVFTSAMAIWFAEHPDLRAVCVTGTKGKSTTASLVAHLLAAAGLRAELRGNVGRPLLDAGPVDSSAVWVVEVSSYQAADLEVSPAVAVLLNLYPEHLDWHRDVATYYRDKLHLFTGQKRGRAVVNRRDEITARFASVFRDPVYFNDPGGIHLARGHVCDRGKRLLAVERIPLRGVHNHVNLCAALTAVGCLGLEPATCVEAVASFRGLPHRLMVVGERDGVLWVDDSISTTPQSAMAAVEAFSDRPITLLLGGYERHLPYDGLARFLVAGPVRAVITMPANGRRIAAVLREAIGERGLPRVIEAESLEEAVARARRVTPAGGVVLLSPAAPSFGAFRDYQERGAAFAQAAGTAAR